MSYFPATITSGAIGPATGGTGKTSTTAYAVQCGGITSTGAFQSIAGLGSSGQVLTSNAASSLPTFQTATGGVSTATSPLLVTGSDVELGSAVIATTVDSNADVNVGLSATTKKFVIQGKQGQTANVLELESYAGIIRQAVSLGSNIIGSGCTLFGLNAGISLQSGSNTTCLGYSAGSLITKNLDNTCIGFNAGINVTSSGNTILGSSAGDGITYGGGNTILGINAGGASGGTSQSQTVQIGREAGLVNTANKNVFTGVTAGTANTTGTDNVLLGNSAGIGVTTSSRLTSIGSSSTGTQSSSDEVNIGQGVDNNVNATSQTVNIGGLAGASGNQNSTVNIGYHANAADLNSNHVVIGSLARESTSSGRTTQLIIGYGAGGSGLINSGSKDPGINNIIIGHYAVQNITGSATLAVKNCVVGDGAGGSLARGDYNAIYGSTAIVASGGTTQSCIYGWNSKADTGGTVIGTNRISTTAKDLIIESADAGLRRVTTSVVKPTDGNGNIAWMQTAGFSRVSSQYNNTGSTLGNVPSLTTTLQAGRYYSFDANLFVDADATDGTKYALSGTALARYVKYEIQLTDNSTSAHTITSRQTAMGGSAGQAGTTAGMCRITGQIQTTSGGSLNVLMAKNAANNSNNSSVLVGSYFHVWDAP